MCIHCVLNGCTIFKPIKLRTGDTILARVPFIL